jgi:hypothetical protein
MPTKKNADTDLVEDGIFADMADDDDFSIDMSDVEEATNELVPPGWYLAQIDNHYDQAVKKEGGKMPAGTPGVNFEFTIIDGPCKGRKVFSGFWFHTSSYPYLKTLMNKSGSFEGVDLSTLKKSDIIEGLLGSQIWIKINIRKGQPKNDGSSEKYDDSNGIREYKSLDERSAPSGSGNPFDD